MSKFSKLGATALALALSLTMVAPITANAEVTWTKDGDYKVYKNEDTKESKSDKDVGGNIEKLLKSEVKAVTITVNSYNEVIDLETTNDVAKFENFKSNKKALKVKVLEKDETLDADKKYPFGVDAWSSDGQTGYYRNVKGETVSVAFADRNKLPKGSEKASYKIRLFTKKAGTYKFSYDAKLKDGSTVKKTIKIFAKADGNPFKSITFAGKNISVNYKANDDQLRLWTKGYQENTTTAKSGTIRVTMNENFKLKKIEVGTPRMKDDNKGDRVVRTDDYDGSSSLAGYYNWKKVKNGKKIKLAKVDESEWDYDKTKRNVSKRDTSTRTRIRITYYDKKNKTTEREYIDIYKVKK